MSWSHCLPSNSPIQCKVLFRFQRDTWLGAINYRHKRSEEANNHNKCNRWYFVWCPKWFIWLILYSFLIVEGFTFRSISFSQPCEFDGWFVGGGEPTCASCVLCFGCTFIPNHTVWWWDMGWWEWRGQYDGSWCVFNLLMAPVLAPYDCKSLEAIFWLMKQAN